MDDKKKDELLLREQLGKEIIAASIEILEIENFNFPRMSADQNGCFRPVNTDKEGAEAPYII